jgi:hypothetical protein
MTDDAPQQNAWGISVGSLHWSTCGMSIGNEHCATYKNKTSKHIPASVLLSRMSGEPSRLDCWAPSHPRGSAAAWPPEATVSHEIGSGRFPLAAAWTGRTADREWAWSIDGNRQLLTSLDAIAMAATQLAKTHARTTSAAIVIPNDFKQREQQRVLDACTAANVNASLLWLPVAAALAWLDTHHDTLPPPQSARTDRLTLPVVHADWGHIRCSTLYLVCQESESGMRWMPARRRPGKSDWSTAGFGWKERTNCNRTEIEAVWQRLFVHVGKEDQLSSISFEPHILEQVAGWSVEQKSNQEVDRALSDHLCEIQSPVAILFVGDFASQIATGPAVSRYLRSAANFRAPIASFIADALEGEDLLAKGAAIFARDQLQGKTSYLDTLPNLELFVDRNNQYEWFGLLGDADQFVTGGQQWELPKPIEGLAIRRGAASIKLVVAHDEYDGVRELQVRLDRPAEQRLAAKLHVSATPAQGNAKLRLVTEEREPMSQKSILANWDRMPPVVDGQNRPVDKAAFLKMQPRAYPELFPRRSSFAKWQAVLPKVEKLIRTVRDEDPKNIMKNPRAMSSLKDGLLAKDQGQTPFDATAIGSDFKAPYDQEKLESLGESLLKLWRDFRHTNLPATSNVIRALGYISVDNTEFDTWLANNIFNQFQDRQCVLHTCGLALRSPESIAKLFDHVFFPKLMLNSPGANELKAISQVLRYRADATRDISSLKCEQAIQICLSIFDRGMEQGGGGFPFRWASLIIVYLLRRRMFDHDFLEPEQELAIDAKSLFRMAIDRHKQGKLRPMGGSVDLPAALQQMINYIDRKGSGDILMAGE